MDKGKYAVTSVPDYTRTRGWVFGEFFPAGDIRNSETLEMGIFTFPVGFSNVLHYNREGTECFVVVSGECDYEMDGRVFHLTTGSVVHTAAGVRKRFVSMTAETTIVIARPKPIPNNKVIME